MRVYDDDSLKLDPDTMVGKPIGPSFVSRLAFCVCFASSASHSCSGRVEQDDREKVEVADVDDPKFVVEDAKAEFVDEEYKTVSSDAKVATDLLLSSGLCIAFSGGSWPKGSMKEFRLEAESASNDGLA